MIFIPRKAYFLMILTILACLERQVVISRVDEPPVLGPHVPDVTVHLRRGLTAQAEDGAGLTENNLGVGELCNLESNLLLLLEEKLGDDLVLNQVVCKVNSLSYRLNLLWVRSGLKDRCVIILGCSVSYWVFIKRQKTIWKFEKLRYLNALIFIIPSNLP